MASDDEHARSEGLGERPANTNAHAAEREAGAAHDDHDELPETIRSRLERLVPELVKKTFAAGLGAVFQTEEGIRKIARENLPDVAGYLASSADGAKDKVFDAKDKVFDVMARETREFLANLNVGEEIAKILTTLSFEIKTEIRFIPNSERFTGAEPEVKASVRLKRTDEKDKDKEKDKEKEKDRERDKDRDRDRDKDRDRDRDRDRDKADEPRSRLRFWQRDGDGSGHDDGSNK